MAWDETKALSGTPGDFSTIARRSGNDWYLGSINSWQERDVNVPLSFLGAGEYTAEIYADGADADAEPTHTSITKKTVRSGETLHLHLAKGGGYAVLFRAGA